MSERMKVWTSLSIFFVVLGRRCPTNLQEHTRPTALIRQWIEQRRDLGGTDLAGRIERLEDAVFHKNAS